MTRHDNSHRQQPAQPPHDTPEGTAEQPHRQGPQYREHGEPEEGHRPVPKAVVAWIAILLVWGVGYYAWQIGKPMLGGDSRSVPEAPAAGEDIDGGAIFSAQCSACHQSSGQGVPGSFPPLAGSAWLQGDPDIPVSIVHDGLQGEIEVEGDSYNGVMPAFGGQLSNAEIAAVLSHVRQEWGNDADPIKAERVDAHEDEYGERDAWSPDELRDNFEAP